MMMLSEVVMNNRGILEVTQSFGPLSPSFSGISKVENMLWIQDIVESTLVLSIFINFKIDMVGFVYPQKVVARRNTFSVFSNA